MRRRLAARLGPSSSRPQLAIRPANNWRGLGHRGCANWRAAISWSMRPRTLIARVEARETLPRQDAPAPLPRRHVPANVAVAEFPLLNDAKSVAEKVEVGRVAWKSRVDDVD